MAQEKRKPQDTRDVTVKQYIDAYRDKNHSDPSSEAVQSYEKYLSEKILPRVYDNDKK